MNPIHPLCCFAFVTVTGLSAQGGVQLVQDLAANPIDAPAVSIAAGDAPPVALFVSPSLLFVTDGTPLGTHLVRDFGPGTSQDIRVSTWIGGRLWFASADRDGVLHPQVFDPIAGTVRRLTQSGSGRRPTGFAPLGGQVAFVAVGDLPVQPSRVWLSDGTASGTRDVSGMFGLPAGSMIWNLVGAAGGRIYVQSSDDLWSWDGGAGGAVRLPLTHATEAVALAGHLYFANQVAALRWELWRSDGTPAGTSSVGTLPGTFGYLGNLLGVGHHVACFDLGREVYAFDTRQNVLRHTGIRASHLRFVDWNGRLAFTADYGIHGLELYVWDPATGAAPRLVELMPGPGSAEPRSLRVVGTELWFSADDGVHGREPWRSDGTAAGTRMVADLVAGPASSHPSGFSPAGGGRVVFVGGSANSSNRAWSSDGTAAGTILLPLDSPGRNAGSSPADFVALHDGAFFTADVGGRREPYFVDALGTVTRLLDLAALPAEAATDVVGTRDRVFFKTSPTTAWVTDGTVVVPSPAGFLAAGRLGDLAIGLATDPLLGVDLAVSDGSVAGTRVLADTDPATPSIVHYAEAGGLGFIWMRSSTATRLWVTDGTPGGTRTLLSQRYGPRSSYAALDDGTVVFEAALGMYRTDGTPAGTQRIQGMPIGTLVSLGSRALIFAEEPYVTDGTLAGTTPLLDLRPGQASSRVLSSKPVVLRGRAFFVADDGAHGEELWITDGTAGGTQRLTDLSPGPEHGVGRALEVIGDRVVFTGITPQQGAELWSTDGTLAGTRRFTDLWAGRFSSASTGGELGVVQTGDRLYLSLDDGLRGRELFVVDWSAIGGGMAYGYGAGCGGAHGVPELRATELPSIVHGRVEIALDRAVPTAPAAFLVGTQRVTVPVGQGCTILVGGAAVAVAAVTDARGEARLAFPVPNLPALVGARISTQAFVAAPGSAWRGLVDASRGLELVFGD